MMKSFKREEAGPLTPSPVPRRLTKAPVRDTLSPKGERARNTSASWLRLSAFCFLPSAFCFLLSAFCFLLSAFCFLLSAFCPLPLRAQVESVENTAPTHYLWVSHDSRISALADEILHIEDGSLQDGRRQ